MVRQLGQPPGVADVHQALLKSKRISHALSTFIPEEGDGAAQTAHTIRLLCARREVNIPTCASRGAESGACRQRCCVTCMRQLVGGCLLTTSRSLSHPSVPPKARCPPHRQVDSVPRVCRKKIQRGTNKDGRRLKVVAVNTEFIPHPLPPQQTKLYYIGISTAPQWQVNPFQTTFRS